MGQGARVGIIGGTGLDAALMELSDARSLTLETPFGAPSAPIRLATWEGVDVAFIARHGPGHRLPPTMIPSRANVWALKKVGVSAILASGATGSLREDIEPGHLVLCDQVIDRTSRRVSTFFDEGLVAHVEFADPFCPRLRSILGQSAAEVGTLVHHAGTYVCMEGPQFSSRAESQLHRQWGGDVVGMTCLPEAKLAREAELCYAMIAFPTDYDCWRPAVGDVDKESLLTTIQANLRGAAQHAMTLLREALARFRDADPTRGCSCQDALRLAIWSDQGRVDPKTYQRLKLLIRRYISDPTDDIVEADSE
jgi:5'-methylthioadenosine phosphorylase